MRNLRIASLRQPRLHLDATPKDPQTTRIAATAIDPDDDAIYVVTAAPSHITEQRVDLDVWRLGSRQLHLSSFSTPKGPHSTRSLSPLHRTASTSSSSSSSKLHKDKHDAARLGAEVISAVVLADGGSTVQNEPAVCIVCAGGDIALTPTSGLGASHDGHNKSSFGGNVDDDEEPSLPEIAGSVEQGILAAAWSPDQELLVLVTAPESGDANKGPMLLIMTREFEVLSESVLQTDDFGEERPITLGWGSKSTQFHGSEGKQAAEAAALREDGASIQRCTINEDDDEGTRISWRGDSTVFVVSAVEGQRRQRHRIVRTFGRNGNLLATSDPEAQGMSHALAFKPTGILWATTQRIDGEHRLSFFERNGLYKDHFALQQAEEQVHELAWNSDGTLLAVWTAQKMQIWTIGNYHWYLKQQIQPASPITCFAWHPEKATQLYVATHDRVQAYHFHWQACISPGQPPHDAACAAVVDGSRVLLTPFRIQNVPPPMSSTVLSLSPAQVPIDLAWSDASDAHTGASILYILLGGGVVQAWAFVWGDLTKKGQQHTQSLWKQPRLLCTFDFGLSARQVAAASTRKGDSVETTVGILASEGFESLKIAVRKVHIGDGTMGNIRFESLSLGKAMPRLLVGVPHYVEEDALGAVFVHERKVLRNVTGHLQHVHDGLQDVNVVIGAEDEVIVLGLTRAGHLYANERLLAQNVTSYTTTDTHLVWLNVAHEARFLPLADLLEGTDALEVVSMSRRVERGSRIVTAVPSNMSLVLQMPRGNLETISPRPLLLEVVRRSLDAKRYKKAFNICRTHRLDMNLIVDFGEQQLLEDMELFVSQIRESDHLNLFLSSLSPEHVNRKGRTIGIAELTTPEKEAKKARVNGVCDAMRSVLEARPEKDAYIYTILTAHVRKSPPDHEAALHMLRDLKSRDAALADDACKYVIFLTDADKLFNTALGLYDFTLPLLVAHHSPSRDPQEYLPFLRQLREVQPLELQRFRIDAELKRHDKALTWLLKAGSDYIGQALDFIVKHELYRQALCEVAGNEPLLQNVREHYGDWLMGKQRYKEAGVLFAQCKQPRKALDANVKAGQWQEALIDVSMDTAAGDGQVEQLAKRISDSLVSYGRYTEAASVAFDYLNDVDTGVRLLCRDAHFGEAKRRAVLSGRHDLIDTCIRPMVFDAAKSLLKDIYEMSEQSEKQFVRLAELRIRKREHPDDYYPAVPGEAHLDDAASLAFSTFTRYTRFSAFTMSAARKAPGSTMSQFTMATKKQENQAAKSSKREMRKQHTGKKGSIYEEDYIYESLEKLLGARLGDVQKMASNVLVHLVRMGNGDVHAPIGFDDVEDNVLVAPMSGEEEDAVQGMTVDELVQKLANALNAFERKARNDAERAWQHVIEDDAVLEQERVRAIQEGLSLGLSWQQLQDNGLFAPPLQRKLVAVSSTEWRLPAILPDM